MSDFIEHLIERHLGIGEQVLPRARSRFEPETAAAVLETLPVNDPTEETIALADFQPAKQSVHFSNQPLIEPVDAAPGEGAVPGHPPQAGEMPAADKQPVINENRVEYNVEKPPGDNGQKTAGPLLSPVSKVEPVKTGKQGHPIHVVMDKTQETTHDQQAVQYSPAAPEPLTAESQPVITTWQHTGTTPGGLLEVPAQLLKRQSDGDKQFLLKESETETEPVVNVTIGRIEVRATRPPEPGQPRPRKKPSGVMSLDQYLGRRVQGGNP